MAERNEAVEMDRGSRSALIVAPESRETDPRKPVSSQGGRRFYGTATGKHGMNSESFRNVLTRQWRIATGRKTRKTEEPDARNGRIRICGGAFGEIRGATRQRHLPTGFPPFIPFALLSQSSAFCSRVALAF